MNQSPLPDSPQSSEAIPVSVFRRLLDATTDPIAIAKPNGDLIYLNCWARILAGVAPQTPPESFSLARLQPAWAWEIVRSEGIPAALQHGSWSSETALLQLGQSEVPVQQTLVTIAQDEGEGTHWIGSIMRDLSEVKQARLDGIAESSRYETALRLNGQVIFDLQPHSGDMSWSGDLQGLLALDSDDLAGGLAHFRSRLSDESRSAFDLELHRFLTAGDHLSVELRLRTGHGDYRDFILTGGYYLDRQGRMESVSGLLSQSAVGIHRENERLREELLHQTADHPSSAARNARSEFLSRMSHELRTPLNAILGFTQLLELDSPTERQAESIAHVSRAGQHLLSLINEVLDLSRLETGRLPLSIQPTALVPLLREVVALIAPAGRRQSISLLLDARDELGDVRVQADPQRLRQILLNFLSNAVRYNRHGGQVIVRWRPAPRQQLRISVEDTGAGMPESLIKRLFQPFETAGAIVPESAGAGISLALSRGIAEAMNGKIGVNSIEGVGSTFWIELPLAEAAVDPERQSPAAQRPAELPHDARGARKVVLYIEDEDLNLQLVERIFADLPEFKLITAMEGGLALELAREHRPDLILLDLNLPDIPGDLVLAQLQVDPLLSAVPVVMVTADVLEHRRERLIAAGASGYLTKPFRINEFIAVVRKALEKPGEPAAP